MAFPLAAIPIIGKALDTLFGVIDKAVPDKDLRERLKAETQAQLAAQDHSELMATIEAQARVIAAEAQGESWLQRNWRPLLMVTCIAIVANNHLFVPVLGPLVKSLTGHALQPAELSDRLWDLMTLGVGGYIAGRSAEKFAAIWKNGGK